ncbi:MAG: hypothetical protein ACI3XZ_06825 [Butyricicoccus sp.]
MHIDDMKAPQRSQTADIARNCAVGMVLALVHHWVWLLGVLGFVLITLSAGKLSQSQPGFDRVQRFAGLCAGCKLVQMALSGMEIAVLAASVLLPVFETLLVYALWQAFGRMCADGNGIGRAALCAAMLCAALTIASNVLALGAAGGLQTVVYVSAQAMALGFDALAAVLLAAFLFVKRRKIKEDTT